LQSTTRRQDSGAEGRFLVKVERLLLLLATKVGKKNEALFKKQYLIPDSIEYFSESVFSHHKKKIKNLPFTQNHAASQALLQSTTRRQDSGADGRFLVKVERLLLLLATKVR
jgi:hypothetical protein